MVLYLDTLFVTELAADYMLLLAADRLCAANAGWKRLLAGAGVGAVYAAICGVWGGVWSTLPMKLLSALLMLLAAFGGRRKLWRCGLVFLLSAAVFAGIVLAVSLTSGGFGARQLLLSFGGAYALLGGVLRFSAAGGGKTTVVLEKGDRRVTLTALRDTGSGLRDPISGAAAILAPEERLLSLLTPEVRLALEQSRGLSPPQRLERLWQENLGTGFKLLPYRAVGVENGLLLAFRLDRACVGGRMVKGGLAALAPGELAPREDFTAIVNAEV